MCPPTGVPAAKALTLIAPHSRRGEKTVRVGLGQF